jgi:hypothetical protein
VSLCCRFSPQLFDIAQREGEAHVFALQAEEKSEFWTQKMEVRPTIHPNQKDAHPTCRHERVRRGASCEKAHDDMQSM